MENTSGFYKLQDGELLWGSSVVSCREFDLVIELKEDYTLPIDGWYWFDSIEEAQIFFEI